MFLFNYHCQKYRTHYLASILTVLLLAANSCKVRTETSSPKDLFTIDGKSKGFVLRLEAEILRYVRCDNYDPSQPKFSINDCSGINKVGEEGERKLEAIKAIRPVVRDRCDYLVNAKVEEWKKWLALNENQETKELLNSLEDQNPPVSEEQKNIILKKKIAEWPEITTLSNAQSLKRDALIRVIKALMNQKFVYYFSGRKDDEKELEDTTIQNDVLDDLKSKMSLIIDAEREKRELPGWQNLQSTLKFEAKILAIIAEISFDSCVQRFRNETNFKGL